MSVILNEYKMPQHASSQLLDDEENNILHKLIGRKAECLSMAVIQLFFSAPPTHSHWIKESAGVLCLVKDNVCREFILKVYNMDSQYYSVDLEEYLHAPMEYREDNIFFHTFHSEDKIVAFNFTNCYEASTMNSKIQEKLHWLRNRLKDQMNPRPTVTSAISTEQHNMSFKIQNANSKISSVSAKLSSKRLTIIKKGDKTKKLLKKSDIGVPTNFTHTMHYGINMEKNFSLEDCPTELRTVLKDVKITNTQLEDPQIREVIRNTLDMHRMSNINTKPSNLIDFQKEIEREENYMVRHKFKNVGATTLPDPSTCQFEFQNQKQSKSINVQKDIEREENYMVRYKYQTILSNNLQRNSQQSECHQMPDISMLQEKDRVSRVSTSGDVALQMAVDQSELFSAINNRRRSKETADGTSTTNELMPKLPRRQPTLKNQNRPGLILPRKDSKLSVSRPQVKESLKLPAVMIGRSLPPIPVGNIQNDAKKLAPYGRNKHGPPTVPPPPTPNKESSKSSSGPPAPPPPPPMCNAPPPPYLPSFILDSNATNTPTNTDGKSALLNDIRKGTTLKPSDLNDGLKTSSTGLGSSRNDLLHEIRMGMQLNPVQARNPNIIVNDEDHLSTQGNDLASALSRALKIRSTAIQSDDDTNDETEGSEDDWDA